MLVSSGTARAKTPATMATSTRPRVAKVARKALNGPKTSRGRS